MSTIKTLDELVRHLNALKQGKQPLELTKGTVADPALDTFLDALPNKILRLQSDFVFVASKNDPMTLVVVTGTVVAPSGIDINPLGGAKLASLKAELVFEPKPSAVPSALKAQVKFTEGLVNIGSNNSGALEVPVEGRWLSGTEIGIASAAPVDTGKDVDKVAKLISGGDLQLVLTEDLKKPFEKVNLSGAAFLFDLKQQSNTLIALKSETATEVVLVDFGEDRKIAITKIGIGMEAEFERYAGAKDGERIEVTHTRVSGAVEIFGEVEIGEDVFYRISLTQFSEHHGLLSVRKTNDSLPSLAAIAGLVGGQGLADAIKNATEWLAGEPLELTLEVQLDQFQVAFNPDKGKLRWAAIGSSAKFAPFGMDPPLELRSHLRLQARPTGLPAVDLHLGLVPGTKVKITSLLAALLRAKPEDLKGLPGDADLTDFRLDIAPSNKYYALAVEVENNFLVDLGVLKLGLTKVNFELEYASDGLTIDGKATFVFGTIPFFVSVGYEHSGGEHNFKFKSGTPEDKSVKLLDFLKAIKEQWPHLNFNPEGLPGIEVKNLLVSFETKSKKFEFTTGLEIHTGEQEDRLVKEIKGKIKITLKPVKKDLYADKPELDASAKIEGTLQISETVFSISLDFGRQDKVEITAEAKTNDLTIQALARHMGYASFTLPRGLNFGLEGIKFNYKYKDKSLNLQATSTGLKGTAFLRSARVPKETEEDLEFLLDDKVQAYVVGMELKDVSLRSIPVIGEILRNVDFLKFDPIRFLLGSRHVKEFEITPGDKIEVWRGISLQGKFKIGTAEKKFNQKLYAPKKSEALSADSAEADEMAAGKVTWLELQRNIGVLQVKRVGFQYGKDEKGNYQIGVLLDAGIKSSALLLTFYGLSVRFPPAKFEFKNVSIGLQGIQAGFKADGIQVRGGFLRTGDKDAWDCVGEAAIRYQEYGFAGIGGYSAAKNKPGSMFAFAYFGIPFGDPRIKVTGLAAGFGFNRAVDIPSIDKLEDFELIKIVQADEEPTDYREILKTFPVSYGNVWLTAGIKLTAVEVIDILAMPILSMGTQMEIHVLGIGGVKLPKGKPMVGIEMLLQGGISLSDGRGRLIVAGILTKQSYLLIKEAKLEGGFALCFWFPVRKKGAPPSKFAGDFLFSVGGYHPRFKAPDYYPKLPAVGFNCKIGEHVTIKANFYFAITTSCVMLGGKLELVCQYKQAKAWLEVQADFLIAWQPFKFDVDFRVTLGVSVKITVIVTKTVTATFGAVLKLHGPDAGDELAGEFEFKIAFVTYTMKFGKDVEGKDQLVKWSVFKQSYLETGTKSFAPPGQERSEICQTHIARGLIKEIRDPNDKKKLIGWVVDPAEAVVVASSAVPAKKVFYNGIEINGTPIDEAPNSKFGIGMVGVPVENFHSQLRVTVASSNLAADVANSLTTELALSNVPQALWSPKPVDTKNPPVAGVDSLITNAVTGLRFGDIVKQDGPAHKVDRATLLAKDTKLKPRTGRPLKKPNAIEHPEPIKRLQDTIAKESVSRNRKSILETLAKAQFNVNPEVRVDKLSEGKHDLVVAPKLSQWVDLSSAN